jgi:hypothetical protein
MKEKRSPIQVYYLFKSFVIMFMIQAVIVFFTPLGLTAAIWYQILAVNLIVGGVLGWFLYKQWYHIEFSYDEYGFQLRKGKTPSVNAKWSEFYRVSLARNEYGEFSVRLYRNGDWLEIPVSKLKINPFHFRLQVTEFTQKAMALSK